MKSKVLCLLTFASLRASLADFIVMAMTPDCLEITTVEMDDANSLDPFFEASTTNSLG
jgi:hypothetical protein